MKANISYLLCLLLVVVNFSNVYCQHNPADRSSAPICDNEDFEAGPGGPVTTTAAISGWNTYKLVVPPSPPSPLTSNCVILTSTAVTRANPTAAFFFTANGYIDTLLGQNYPVYSVFGSGSSNGGEAFNPGIAAMYGNSFFRIGDASGTPYNHHSIEKTINVTAANSLFRFAYLSVVKGTGSSCCDVPSVQVKFFNATQSSTLLPCPVYSVNAPSGSCSNTTTPPMIATTNTSIPSSGTYYHKWKIAAVDLTPYIGNTIIFKMAVTYCNAGCTKYGYAYVDAQCSPMQVFVNGTPFPANTNSVTFSGCQVSSATVVAPPDFSSYQWSGPAGFSATLSTITTSASGVYTLNIFTSGTCSVITKYVNINLYPAASVSIATSNTLSCSGNKIKLTASGLTTFTWSVPGNSSTISPSPTITTTYTVSGTNSNGCFGSAIITQSVTSCVGIHEELNSEAGFIIYPNPNNGEFTLKTDKVYNSCTIYLKNALGQVVHSQQIIQGDNCIKTKGLSAGIYYCTIIADKRIIQTGKMEIE